MTDGEKNIIFSVDKENEEKIVVNKSIFIGIIRKVENRKEILKFKEEVMKRYPNATHYVLAYKIFEEEFFDDDGEPSKTSGFPILKCILGNNLNNTCIIVVRYFGGILLGTGGLVKTYTESAKTVISTSNIVRYIRVKKIKLVYRYDDISKIKRIIEEIGRIKIGEETFVDIISEKYTEKVELEIYISYNICDILKKKIEVDNIINVNKSESEIKSEIIFKEQEGYMYVKLK
mgnify:FL=1